MSDKVHKQLLVSDIREMITCVSMNVIRQNDWNAMNDKVRKQVLVSYVSMTERDGCMRKHVLMSYVSMTKEI